MRKAVMFAVAVATSGLVLAPGLAMADQPAGNPQGCFGNETVLTVQDFKASGLTYGTVISTFNTTPGVSSFGQEVVQPAQGVVCGHGSQAPN